jgi:hypothetical protein
MARTLKDADDLQSTVLENLTIRKTSGRKYSTVEIALPPRSRLALIASAAAFLFSNYTGPWHAGAALRSQETATRSDPLEA